MEAAKYTTKSGKEITIRTAMAEDAQALLALKLDYLENTKTIPLYQNEYPNEVELESQLIKRLEAEKNSVLLLAEVDNKLIGNIDLNGNQRIKLFHTGVVGMGISEEWRGDGVGSALLDAVIKWSEVNPFISLLWLEVYDSNEAGKALYAKMGFKECGRIQNFFCEDDKFIDKIMMMRFTK